jgi:hypothetical protein
MPQKTFFTKGFYREKKNFENQKWLKAKDGRRLLGEWDLSWEAAEQIKEIILIAECGVAGKFEVSKESPVFIFRGKENS